MRKVPPAPPSDDDGDNNTPAEKPVGYKNPPVQHRFKPGQSGNSRGRKKGAIGLRKIVGEELSSTIKIDVGKPGAPRIVTLSKLQVVVKRTVEMAMKGDPRAISQLITLNITIFGLGEDDTATESKLSPGEQAYLEALARRLPPGDAEAGHEADPSAVARESDDDSEKGDVDG